MPARKRPTPQDAATARRILLDGMARDTEVSELAGELAPLHPRDDTFPGEVLLQIAADALDWCEASRADPLALEGMPQRFLPECAFRGRQNKKLQFAVLAAAALHGGAEPDLLDEVAWWQPTTSGNTPCTRRPLISEPPPAEPACQCARYARNWPSSPAAA
jgi:hypothetical protein